jgi:hypothetical protein
MVCWFLPQFLLSLSSFLSHSVEALPLRNGREAACKASWVIKKKKKKHLLLRRKAAKSFSAKRQDKPPARPGL